EELSFKGRNLIIPFFFNAIKLHSEKKYDLIHVHCPFSLLSVIPLKVFRIPIVLTIHGNWINCVKGRRYYKKKICNDFELNRCAECMNSGKTIMKIKRKILVWAAENSNQIIAVSSEVKNSIVLSRKKEISVIPNVASNQGFFPDNKALKEFPFNSNRKKILFIGSMIEEKGAKVLLEAAKNINELFIFVYSYADKKYLAEFNEYKNKNNLNTVFLYSLVSNKKIREKFIPFSDLIVIPSLWPEPCSTIVTEAMASRKPVIASKTGGFTDLIEDKKDGLLFDAGNSVELSEKIKLVLDNKNLSEKISENAFIKVQKKLNWNKISEETIKIYRKVLK
ncbi:MAG: glycosyltransferase family 4 protein, partial [Candidatus Micrarchaeota archaeon]